MDEYNKLRKSLGMAPAGKDDLGEVVAFVVVFELLTKTVADECGSLPADERDVFMMTFAAYLKWLVMLTVEAKSPVGTWQIIRPVLERELARQPWHRSQMMESIYNMMVELPPLEAKGLNFGVLLPWGGAVGATNAAGFKLTDSVNMRFQMYVVAITSKVSETLAKMIPERSQDNEFVGL